MRVKLTEDVRENGAIKVAKRGSQPAVVYEKDTVVDMSDASAQKYIKQGKAVAYVDVAS